MAYLYSRHHRDEPVDRESKHDRMANLSTEPRRTCCNSAINEFHSAECEWNYKAGPPPVNERAERALSRAPGDWREHHPEAIDHESDAQPEPSHPHHVENLVQPQIDRLREIEAFPPSVITVGQPTNADLERIMLREFKKADDDSERWLTADWLPFRSDINHIGRQHMTSLYRLTDIEGKIDTLMARLETLEAAFGIAASQGARDRDTIIGNTAVIAALIVGRKRKKFSDIRRTKRKS